MARRHFSLLCDKKPPPESSRFARPHQWQASEWCEVRVPAPQMDRRSKHERAGAVGNGFEPKLKAVTRSLGNKIEIRIRDNGAGIPPDIQEKIFNPFFTTKPAGEGTGLGLSMSHDIVVKQHGDTIEVTTEPGSFTEFIIRLPRAMPAQAEAEGQRS